MKKDQLKMMYDLLIKPDDEAKLVALKYAYNHASGGDGLKLRIENNYFSLRFDELLDRIKNFKAWYEPSLFHFILKCGKAEWV